ncbi:MAG: pantoate--beta-alanine ligase [Coriobacteriia bacterium]|nr:pantoate--beta-alanine ligase [Coriobacteriia bacterium]
MLIAKEEVREALAEARRRGALVGLVPTMGALHEGHLSLVRAAARRCDVTAVSVFVNPTQFERPDDLASYPRDLERDVELLRAEEATFVFAPTAEEVYGGGAEVTVDPGPLARVLEGASRPGHFAGVCTVVVKLLNVFIPDLAFFGEKDFQQLRVLERMVRDLDFGVRVVGCPTVRDADGLAMSSRNAMLSPEDRAAALALPRALEVAREAAHGGELDARWVAAAMDSTLASAPGIEPDYAEVVDERTLEPLERLDRPGRAVVAATVGGVRLIDNAELAPGRTA